MKFTGVNKRRVAVNLATSAALVTMALASRSPAWADDVVTYEVVSNDIGIANIEYQDSAGRVALQSVALPWRAEVAVNSVRGAPPDGSQVRADWRPSAAPGRWVSVRIVYQGKILCQNTLDVGDASCYGITPRIT
jgi:hypothetical protein